MDWDWDCTSPNRYNPMDSGTHARIDISVLQIIDSLRMFVTGKTGTRQMSSQEFAAILFVAQQSAERC